MRYLIGFLCVCAGFALGGCDGTTTGNGGTGGAGGSESRYAAENLWLCRPGIANDQCALADLSTTEVHLDGSSVVSDGPAMNPDAPFDCFVVYETVDFTEEPGNAGEPSPTEEAILEALYRNGARFRGTCRMYAPLYRQMTLGTYWASDPWEESAHFQRAYDDIVEAFDYYMREHNQGRDMVLIGHSQGAHVLTRLMEERFETDEALLGQLISALLIGAGGTVHVPAGELVGGNFKLVPLCSSETDTGCVIAVDSVASVSSAAATKQLPSGNEQACVNPVSFDGSIATLAAAMFSQSSVWSPQIIAEENATTDWVSYPTAFNAFCAGGFLWVGVANADAAPFTPFELREEQTDILNSLTSRPGSAGLHWSNFSLIGADLIRIVETQARTGGPGLAGRL